MGAITLASGDYQRARQWANLTDDERRRRAVTAARDRDLETLWQLCHAHLLIHGRAGARLSSHTAEAYRQGVQQLLVAWRGENLLHPTRDAGSMWLRSMESAGQSAATVRVRLAGARALYRALRWAGATDADPFADAMPARDPTPAHEKRQPYPPADIDQLLAIADSAERALILLAGHGGLRVSECLSLRWTEVDLSGGRLRVIEGKGGKSRTVVFGPTLRNALAALERTDDQVLPHRTDEWARKRLRILCGRAGCTYRGIHALRHACGTRLMRETGDIHRVARHLGHSSVATSQIYIAWSDDQLDGSVGQW